MQTKRESYVSPASITAFPCHLRGEYPLNLQRCYYCLAYGKIGEMVKGGQAINKDLNEVTVRILQQPIASATTHNLFIRKQDKRPPTMHTNRFNYFVRGTHNDCHII